MKIEFALTVIVIGVIAAFALERIAQLQTAAQQVRAETAAAQARSASALAEARHGSASVPACEFTPGPSSSAVVFVCSRTQPQGALP